MKKFITTTTIKKWVVLGVLIVATCGSAPMKVFADGGEGDGLIDNANEDVDIGAFDENVEVDNGGSDEKTDAEEVDENDDVNDLIRSKNLARFMHTPLMLCSYEDDFAKLLPPKVGKNKSIYILLGNGAIPIAKRKSYKYIDWDEIYFTMETYDDIVESYNIGFKRKDELTLKMKKEDIWTNDKYKY